MVVRYTLTKVIIDLKGGGGRAEATLTMDEPNNNNNTKIGGGDGSLCCILINIHMQISYICTYLHVLPRRACASSRCNVFIIHSFLYVCTLTIMIVSLTGGRREWGVSCSQQNI